jgi:hypothetical protein
MNIELISCSATMQYDATFVTAATKWMSVISGDLADYEGWTWFGDRFNCIYTNGTNADSKAATSILECGDIDDLIIAFDVMAIDGVSGVLGSAASLFTRGVDGASGTLPVTGYMKFDSVDLDAMASDGSLESVVFHELGHVLGISSTGWNRKGLLWPEDCKIASNFTAGMPKFTGSNGNSSLRLIDPSHSLGLSYVAVEEGGGSGTRCSHWKD